MTSNPAEQTVGSPSEHFGVPNLPAVPNRPTSAPTNARFVQTVISPPVPPPPVDATSLPAIPPPPRAAAPPPPPAQVARSTSSQKTPLLWPARILFAFSMVSWQLLLIVDYAAQDLFDSLLVYNLLFSSYAAILGTQTALAIIGIIGLLMANHFSRWRLPIAILLVVFVHICFVIFDSDIISDWLMTNFGVQIDSAFFSLFFSVFSIALLLIPWSLVRGYALWALGAAFAYGVVGTLIAAALSEATYAVLNDLPLAAPLSMSTWVVFPLLGLVIMHLLGRIGSRHSTVTRSGASDTHSHTSAQPAALTPTDAPTSTSLPQTNTLAILALIFSFVIGLVGVILGHVALNQIARTGQEGRGLALAGLVIGYISVALSLFFSIRAIYLISQLF